MRGARLGDDVVSVGIVNGRIERISSKIEQRAGREIEAGGKLLTPPFIESHVHLDTTLTASEPRWNESGTLFEGIRIWSERKKSVTREDVVDRATSLLRWQAAQGVLHVRTHVDITDLNLVALKALLELKEEVRDWMDLQIVAFPQEGILSYPKGAELLEESLRMGAEEAACWGLVNSVVPGRELIAQGRAVAEKIADAAPLAVAAVKEVTGATEHLSIEEAYATLKSGELTAYQRMLASEDVVEGPRAFAENRQPVWRGR